MLKKYGLAAWFFMCLAGGALVAGWYDYSTTAASNTTINGVAVPVGALPPSNVGPALRGIAGADAAYLDDTGCAVTSSGTDTITFNAVSNPYSGAATYADGDTFCFIAGGTNTGAATFNVDSEGAKAIRKEADAALVSGDIVQNAMYVVRYDASANGASGAFLIADVPRTLNGRTLATATLTSPTVNGITNGTGLAAGVYSPTDSANVNLDSATPQSAQYMRVGATVTVSMVVTVDVNAGAGAVASFELDLPVASNFGAVEDCAGTAVFLIASTAQEFGRVYGVAANDTCKVDFNPTSTTSGTMTLIFAYQVI